MFDAIGVSEAIERAGFIRSTGNTVWWGSDTPRVELFAEGGRGWQVEAEALAAVLLDEAARAGVRIERRVFPSRQASGPKPHGPKPPSPKPQRVVHPGLQWARSGVLARANGLRVYDEGPRTIALVASWRSERDWNLPDASHTVVESYEGGWAWSVPTSPTHRHIAVMVDPERSGLARGALGA